MQKGFHIKNMVCDRCIKSVDRIFRSHGIIPATIKLGYIEIANEVSPSVLSELENELEQEGFAVLKDKQASIIEQVKSLVVDLISSGKISNLNKNLSALIEEKIGKEYHYVSALFSQTTGLTIARYLILQKTEKAKELLSYGEDSLGAISKSLGYSSVNHFSNQFKEVTGMSPSEFRDQTSHDRKQLDKIDKS